MAEVWSCQRFSHTHGMPKVIALVPGGAETSNVPAACTVPDDNVRVLHVGANKLQSPAATGRA